jgi:hypothetical protein
MQIPQVNFYTYLWLREDGTPYYVGKGKGDRGFISDGHRVSRPKDRERIIVQEWPSEKDAFEAERFLIGDSLRGRKYNRTAPAWNKGKTYTRSPRPDEVKKKISESVKRTFLLRSGDANTKSGS